MNIRTFPFIFIALVIGFIFGSAFMFLKEEESKKEESKKNNKEKDSYKLILFAYNELLLFIIPIGVLAILLWYSYIAKDILLILLTISFGLPIIFMENMLKRRKFENASLDLLSVRFTERISYIFLLFGVIVGIIYTINKVGIIR